jgi:hypothetical protein
MNKYPIAAIGYLTADDRSLKGNATPLGLQTLVFGSPNEPLVQEIASDGNVTGFSALPPLSAHDFFPVTVPVVPQVGSPHICALVTDPNEPAKVEAMYWPDMPARLLASYVAMRPELKKHPVAGFRIANFVLALAPAYAAAGKLRMESDMDPFLPERELLAMDDEHRYRRSPEVKQLAKENGYDLKDSREYVPLP